MKIAKSIAKFELQEVVSEESLNEEEVRRGIMDIRPRDKLCIKKGGGNLESQLKKYRRGTIKE